MPANFFVVNIFFGIAVTDVSSEAACGAVFALLRKKQPQVAGGKNAARIEPQ